ncbi:hypothetical protein TWF694_000336 [Orbilia ellipsospora]|uniref:Ribosomal protein L36 n=1 Tax=Orbilia ellipsospora TaxID=2528407 RepID=A0AAV9XN99_9PEZI
MTKTRVPPEKRVRVAQACARCKRRKEKAQLSGTVGDIRTSGPPNKKRKAMIAQRDPFSEAM